MSRLILIRVRLAAATAVSAMGLAVLVACSAGPTGAPAASGTSPCPPSISAHAVPHLEHNLVDATFLRQMLPYRLQAVAMSSQVGSRALSVEVKDLSDRIDQRQESEIAQMDGMLIAWREPRPQPGAAAFEGMPSSEQMAKLGATAGPAFDRSFLELMIAHHRAALAPARTELDRGMNDDARELACGVIAEQAETAQMQAMLRTI